MEEVLYASKEFSGYLLEADERKTNFHVIVKLDDYKEKIELYLSKDNFTEVYPGDYVKLKGVLSPLKENSNLGMYNDKQNKNENGIFYDFNGSCTELESKNNYFLYKSHYEKYYVYEENNDREVGDYLVIEASPDKVRLTTYESQFNFKDYLQNKGVKRELKIKKIDSKFNSPIRIKHFKNKLLSSYSEDTKSLLKAFLFNEKDYESNAIKFTSELKLTHLFSMSGIYLHFIFAALAYILALKLSEKASELLPFLILLPYAFFSFNKIGTLRVYGLYLLKFINKYKLKKKFNHIELVSLLALFFLSIDYHLVYQESFYIGFSLSILIPFINNSLAFLKKKKLRLLFPFIIWAYMLPIAVSDGTLNIFSIFYSALIFIPNTIFLILTMLNFIIPMPKVINYIGSILIWILEKMDLINISIPFATWGGTFAIIFYFLFIYGIYLLEGVRKKQFKILTCSIISLILIAIVPLQEPLINAVYFINVGQGDSILIKNRSHTVLIDTGGYKGCDMALDSLIPFMHKHKITHIDALITTHDDFDHNGAASSLVQNFKVKNYLTSKDDFPYEVGDLYFENLNVFESTSDNDASLVLSLDFMNKKWLFMGDASTKVENMIIDAGFNVDVDIIKIGHHGSKYSTSEKFLKAATPDTAIISCGAKNYYGHPNEETLDRLRKCNVKIRRTDEEGTISYLSLIA